MTSLSGANMHYFARQKVKTNGIQADVPTSVNTHFFYSLSPHAPPPPSIFPKPSACEACYCFLRIVQTDYFSCLYGELNGSLRKWRISHRKWALFWNNWNFSFRTTCWRETGDFFCFAFCCLRWKWNVFKLRKPLQWEMTGFLLALFDWCSEEDYVYVTGRGWKLRGGPPNILIAGNLLRSH